MIDFGVGVMHNTINSRFGPKPLVHADYMTGLACGADSFWVADHLNSVLPPSMWTPKHVGAAKLIPKMDAHLEALAYAAKVPRSLVEELFAVGTPDEVIDQLAEFRDRGLRYLVVGNAGAIQPSLRKSVAATAPYIKVVRGLRKL
jgi:tRNA U34 5-methylaminomethyl-2-thiouridine-forming methyltransferase MnmC